MSSDLAELRQIIEVFGATEEEAAAALVSAFRPPQPNSLVQIWKNCDYFGRSAPTPQEVWEIYQRDDFRCASCGTVRSLTLDHIDGNPTNHDPANLRCQCRQCNRPAGRATVFPNHDLTVFREMVSGGTHRRPAFVRRAAGLGKGGCNSFVWFLRHRLGWWGRVKRLVSG